MQCVVRCAIQNREVRDGAGRDGGGGIRAHLLGRGARTEKKKCVR